LVSGLWGYVGNRPGEGEVVCAQCGLVVVEAAVDTGPEWRVFEKEKRVRTAPPKPVAKTDMAVKPEHGVQWRSGEVSQRDATRPGEEAG
jgi:transcription initiation factor TFIIB